MFHKEADKPRIAINRPVRQVDIVTMDCECALLNHHPGINFASTDREHHSCCA